MFAVVLFLKYLSAAQEYRLEVFVDDEMLNSLATS